MVQPTWRDVFRNPGYRALYAAGALSWIGDYMAKAAVTALVFRDTHSPAIAASAFAISYVPWVIGGPFLAAVAERYRYRTVMVLCDLGRFLIVGVLALPGVPVPAMIGLLFLAALGAPPFESSRAALMPRLLPDDMYVLGITANQVTAQSTQVIGYLIGGGVAAFAPHLAIAINAVTFGVSAVILRFAVPDPDRPIPARRHLWQETADGFRVVFGRPILRSIVLLVWATNAAACLPEGLAAAWAGHLGAGAAGQSWIMAANPIGAALGAVLVVGRLSRTRVRQLVRPAAFAIPAVLVAALIDPPLGVVIAISLVVGLAGSMVVGPANGLFVENLPPEYRARAFGVVVAGLQLSTGGAVATVGVLSTSLPVAVAVGLWGPLILIVLGVVTLTWPKPAAVPVPAEVAAP